jgi:signal transduction histidine kinase
MACVDGATETEPSILLGAFHVLAPFTTVPFFLANGTNRVWAIIGPLICALVSGYGYLLLARRGQRWRQERHERELREAEQRFQRSEREREQLVRDLHDSVASELSLVALLVQTRARDPAHAAELAPILNAARTGLASLRSVLHAIPQAPIQLQLLAAGLMMICEPFARSLGASLQVMVKRGETAILSGHLRTAVVRMFREVVHNALRHGGARRIEVIFEADDDHLYLEVADDGAGFDPATRHAGMGLRGMRERARELGGSFEVASTPGQGTRVWIVSPLRRVECPR